ncbi:MAG: hypothetical protein ACTS73_00090 [Arsenophonus sp. NEOnobi-MAG3]
MGSSVTWAARYPGENYRQACGMPGHLARLMGITVLVASAVQLVLGFINYIIV